MILDTSTSAGPPSRGPSTHVISTSDTLATAQSISPTQTVAASASKPVPSSVIVSPEEPKNDSK